MNLDLLFEDAVESEDPKTRRMLRKLETIRRGMCAGGGARARSSSCAGGRNAEAPRDLSQVVQEFVDFYTPEALQVRDRAAAASGVEPAAPSTWIRRLSGRR